MSLNSLARENRIQRRYYTWMYPQDQACPHLRSSPLSVLKVFPLESLHLSLVLQKLSMTSTTMESCTL